MAAESSYMTAFRYMAVLLSVDKEDQSAVQQAHCGAHLLITFQIHSAINNTFSHKSRQVRSSKLANTFKIPSEYKPTPKEVARPCMKILH